MARKCPNCSATMTVKNVEGVNLEVCPVCAGTWFDPEALRGLLARDPEALNKCADVAVPTPGPMHGSLSARTCPTCAVSLTHFHYMVNSPVILDTCSTCGGFFADDGELRQMQQVLDQGRGPITADEQTRIDMAETKIAHDTYMENWRFYNWCATRPGFPMGF